MGDLVFFLHKRRGERNHQNILRTFSVMPDASAIPHMEKEEIVKLFHCSFKKKSNISQKVTLLFLDVNQMLQNSIHDNVVFYDLSRIQNTNICQLYFGCGGHSKLKQSIKSSTLKGSPFDQLRSNFKFTNTLRSK